MKLSKSLKKFFRIKAQKELRKRLLLNFQVKSIQSFDSPIFFGYGRFKLFMISTNSSRDFDKRGLNSFSSATVDSNWPLKCKIIANVSMLSTIKRTCNHELDKYENSPAVKRFSRGRNDTKYLRRLLGNQFVHIRELKEYLQWKQHVVREGCK